MATHDNIIKRRVQDFNQLVPAHQYDEMLHAHSTPSMVASSDRKSYLIGPLTGEALQATGAYNRLPDTVRRMLDPHLAHSLNMHASRERYLAQLDHCHQTLMIYKGTVTAAHAYCIADSNGKLAFKLTPPKIELHQGWVVAAYYDASQRMQAPDLSMVLEHPSYTITAKAYDRLLANLNAPLAPDWHVIKRPALRREKPRLPDPARPIADSRLALN